MRSAAVCIAVVVVAAVLPSASEARIRTLEVAATVGGSVTTADQRIDCGADCSARYRRQPLARLRARPDGDFRFRHWTGDCVGTARLCVVALARRTTVAATFTRKRRPVQLLVGGPGTVSGDSADLRCGSTGQRCVGTAGQGTTVRLAATPDAGAVFDSWITGPCAQATSPTCDVPVPSSGRPSVAALFRHATPGVGLQTLTVDSAGADVESTPAGIDCPHGPCSATYAANTRVTLRGLSNDIWLSGCVGEGPICTVVMDGPVKVDVKIKLPAPDTSGFGLTLTVSGPGRVVGSSLRCHGMRGSIGDCRGSFRPGSRVKLRAVPDKGARLHHWWGFCVGRSATCLVRVSTAKTVGAVFKR